MTRLPKISFKIAAFTALLPLSVVLFSPLTSQAQSEKAQPVKPQGYLPLPAGVFHGSLPGKPNPALEEAENECKDAINQGDAFLKAGKAEAARHCYELAIDYVPNDAVALQRIAKAYAIEGKVTEASQAYHKLFYEAKWQTVGGSPTVYLEYAVILAKTGKPAEAVMFYQEGTRRVNYMDGKQNLKVLLPELVAERILPDQVRYTPEHLQALAETAIAHEELGFGSNKEALAHLQEAVKLFPDSPVTHYYLGDALRIKDHIRAKAAYEKAARLGDDQTQAAVKTVLKEMF